MTNILENPVTDLREDYFQAFREATERFCTAFTDHDDNNVGIEGYRQTLRLAMAAHLCHVEADPAFPLLVKQHSLQRQMMLPSADCVYLWSSLHSDYSYRLRGYRGSAHVFQIAINAGSSADYPDFPVTYDRDNFAEPLFAADEELDLVLSARPRPELGNRWVPLPQGASELYIRQYYYDWDNEQPAQLVIEREDDCYPPAPINEADFRSRFEQANRFLTVQAGMARKFVESFLETDPVHLPVISIPGAFEGTRYLNGHFRCEPDEAIILEVDKPEARFWGFQLSNLAWEGLDYYVRQTSINGHQAVIDSDGKFRAVISHRDPGVPNWLDPGGRTLALISGRYFQARTAPSPVLNKVAFDSLLEHLPADTERVTVSQRQETLRNRLLSAHARRCSDQ